METLEIWLTMLILNSLLPLIMLGFGIAFAKHAPKKINNWYGYRTYRSMKNRETWEFAHHYCGQLWKKVSIWLALLTIFAMFIVSGRSESLITVFGLIINFGQLAVLLWTVVKTEKALQQQFNSDN